MSWSLWITLLARGSGRFSVHYTTWLKAPTPGTYKLITRSDDGVRLRLDGRLLIDNWKRGNFTNEAVVELTDKPHELVLDYYEDHGAGYISLHWEQLNGFPEQIIPAEAFFTDKGEAMRKR